MLPALAIAGISGALSLGKSFFGSQDAKKAAKEAQRAQDLAFIAASNEAMRARVESSKLQQANRAAVAVGNQRNRAAVAATNAANRKLGQEYLARPSVDMSRLVADAEAAGFNPLSYLRSGAASLYSKQVNLPGYQMMMPQTFQESVFQWSDLPGMPTPAPAVPRPSTSAGSMLFQAGSDAFGAFVSQSRIESQQDLQRELLQKSLDGVAKGKKAGSKSSGSFGFVPGSVTMGGTVTDKGSLALARPGTPEKGDVKVTNPWTNYSVDPSQRDASAFTDRYGEGEIAETLLLLKQGATDFWYNVTGMTDAQRTEWANKNVTWDNAKPGGAWDQWHWKQWQAATNKLDGWFGGFTGGGMQIHNLPSLGSPL